MESIGTYYRREDECPARDTPEGQIGLFDKVLEVHAVETSYEGARTNPQGSDGEFEVEEHEGVTVCVEDDVDTLDC